MPIISVKKHLTGDITLPKGTPLAHRIKFNQLLRLTAAAARDCKQVWNVNSGYRSWSEQAALRRQNHYPNGERRPGRPLTAKPGESNHEGARALDVSVKTRRGLVPVGNSIRRCRALKRRGLCLPVPGEKWHVERGRVWRAAPEPA